MSSLGVDVGGTHTDLVLFNSKSGEIIINKVPTTAEDPSIGIFAALSDLLKKGYVEVSEISHFIHGTTIATNIALEHNGSKVGLITTKGFRDVLHIARHKRPQTFSLQLDLPWQKYPLVPRRLRSTVEERIVPPGDILVDLDEHEVKTVVNKLVNCGVDSIAVCFLHSYLNPVHELRVKNIISEVAPNIFVSLSHDIISQYREYERFSTTALNCYIGPKTVHYLSKLNTSLKENKIKSSVHLMQSSGGAATLKAASIRPVNLLMSGPAAGLIGGIWVGKSAGFDNIITLDVGGTSADIGVAPNGEILYKHILDTKLGDYNAMVTMAEIDAIGAGGGSIAYLDMGGQFQVGPKSAGANPGPACYGNGGDKATATDCLLSIGWIDPLNFLGGKTKLDIKLAENVILKQLAKPLGKTVKDTASGAIKILIHSMVQACELNSVRKGYDPRDFALIAFGGAGPLFACEIAKEMEIPYVVVPPLPGLASAIGLLATDITYEKSKTVMLLNKDNHVEKMIFEFYELKTSVLNQLTKDGFSKKNIFYRMISDCRYIGQGYELSTEIPANFLTTKNWGSLKKHFDKIHSRHYGKSFPEKPIEVVNIRVVGIGKVPHIEPTLIKRSIISNPSVAFTRNNSATFNIDGLIVDYTTPRYSRIKLLAGHKLSGPAIIDQMDATTVIPPSFSGEIDNYGNIIISKKEEYHG